MRPDVVYDTTRITEMLCSMLVSVSFRLFGKNDTLIVIARAKPDLARLGVSLFIITTFPT